MQVLDEGGLAEGRARPEPRDLAAVDHDAHLAARQEIHAVAVFPLPDDVLGWEEHARLQELHRLADEEFVRATEDLHAVHHLAVEEHEDFLREALRYVVQDARGGDAALPRPQVGIVVADPVLEVARDALGPEIGVDLVEAALVVALGHVEVRDQARHVGDDVREHAHPEELHEDRITYLDVARVVGSVVPVADGRDRGRDPVDGAEIAVEGGPRLLARANEDPAQGHEMEGHEEPVHDRDEASHGGDDVQGLLELVEDAARLEELDEGEALEREEKPQPAGVGRLPAEDGEDDELEGEGRKEVDGEPALEVAAGYLGPGLEPYMADLHLGDEVHAYVDHEEGVQEVVEAVPHEGPEHYPIRDDEDEDHYR